MSTHSHNANEQLFDIFSSSIAERSICMLSYDGKIELWNNGAVNFYQYPAHEIIGKPVSLLLNGLDVTQHLNKAFADGDCSFETTLCRKDGWQFPAYVTFKPLYQLNVLKGYAFTADSLAYSRKMQYRFKDVEQRAENNGLFQQLIAHSYTGITLFDADFNFIYRNAAAARITGFNDDGRTNTSFGEIIHPADRLRIKNLLDELLRKPGASMPCSLRSRHFEGHFIDLEGVFTNWLQEPAIGAIVLNFHDVSETHQKEQALRKAFTELSDYKQALDTSAIVAITDQKGIIKHVNNNFCKISGYSRDELIGQDHRIINSGYHDKAYIKDLWRTIASGKVWEGDLCNRRKDGSIYWVATTIVPFLNDKGKPYQYVAIRFDRTEAKKAKEELIEKNQQINSLLESINEAFIAVDHDLRYTYVNKHTCDLVGLRPEQMLGKKMWDLFPDVVGTSTWTAIEKARNTGVAVINEDYYAPFDLWQENHIYPTPVGLSIFISDISWRKREEQQKALLVEISQVFDQALPPTQLMERALEKLLTFSNCFCLAEIWLLERDHKHLKLAAHLASEDRLKYIFNETSDIRQLAQGKGLPGTTWQSGAVEFWTDLQNNKDFLRGVAASKIDLRSAFGIPVRCNNITIGVLLLGLNCDERLGLMNDSNLTRLGEHLGIAITRKQLENDLQAIFDAASDIICIVGTDRYFKKVNPAMSILLGYTQTELLNMPIDALIHPDDLVESRNRMKKFITGETQSLYFENRYISRAGSVIHLAWSANKGREEGILFCVAKDITDKKIAVEAATQFLTERNTILESIGDAFFSVDRNWIVQYWNHVAEEMVNTPKERILGKNLWDVFPDIVKNVCYTEYHKALATGEATHFEDFYEALGVWYDVNAYPSEKGLSVFFKDITPRKKAEQELKEQAIALAKSQKRYSDLFQLSPLPMFVYDFDTLKFIDVNRATVEHYGFSTDEFLQMTIRDIRPQNEQNVLNIAMANMGESKYFHQPGVFTHVKKNGEQIKVEITSSALDLDGRALRIVLANDVTEQLKNLEAIEMQNKKLREISWMQSHIIRAPLSRILGLVELFNTMGGENNKELPEILEFIKVSANELDEVIRAINHNANEEYWHP